MNVQLQLPHEYRRHLALLKLAWCGLLLAMLSVLCLVLGSHWWVGGMAPVLVRVLGLLPQLSTKGPPWFYSLDTVGVGLLIRPSLCASPQYFFRWQSDPVARIELSHWRAFPALRVGTKRNREFLMVYPAEEQERVLKTVVPILEQHRIR